MNALPSPSPNPPPSPSTRARLRGVRRRVQLWSGRHLPPGGRLLAGLLLMIGGVLGFLPVLGFWMLPLGAAVAALDLVPLWRWLRGRAQGNGQGGVQGNGLAREQAGDQHQEQDRDR